jgi:hypothetical protein
MIRPDEVGGLNPEDLISGDNGHAQKLVILRTMTVANPRNRSQMVERLAEDQWTNVYLIYSAKLSDGEIWEVADRVKPSVIAQHGGMTDALFDNFRMKAFMAFDAQELYAARMRAEAASITAKLMQGAQGVNLGGN